MLAGRRASAGVAFCAALSLFSVALQALAPAAAARTDDIVKYYVVVASYDGKPENLSEIAARFLGTADGSIDIFALNVGRTQPDGGKLTDPAVLVPGWALVLPWDAIGTGVVLGQLPTAPPATITPGPLETSPGSTVPAPPAAGDTTRPAPPGVPTISPPTPDPAPTGTAQPTAATAASGCPEPVAAERQPSLWGQRRLAPDQAWTSSTGDGQVVAVVDSGVAASVSALAGRIVPGVNILSGAGRGDTDCVGSGTAMAGIIAAKGGDGSAIGVAPGATILPVVVVDGPAQPQPEQVASGIQVAVSAGATVIAIGSTVDLGRPVLARAIEAAASHNVVVVVGAPIRATPSGPSPSPSPSSMAVTTVLRVGGIDTSGGLAADYEPGQVDVVAPGVNVTSVGLGGRAMLAGDGTHYAVGFVAGEAALVRAAFPHLSAADVIARIKATTENRVRSAGYGWGMINPAAAVSATIDGEPTRAAQPDSGEFNGLQIALIIVLVAVGSVGALLLGPRLRRLARVPGIASPPRKSNDSDG